MSSAPTDMISLLRPGLYCREIDGDFIMFDLHADRYFMPAAAAADALARFLAGTGDAGDDMLLRARGLITEARPEQVEIAPATASLVDMPLAPAPLCMTIVSVSAQARARRDLRRRKICDIVRRLAETPDADAPGSAHITHEVAAAFLRARRHVHATDQCLARGIAMKRILTRRGCSSSLVFGVSMPFAAHCWVQAGATVLTDPLDVVLRYQPIFAV
ncbi:MULTISPECIES: lasso peptide biosynthesis B2 protein [Novosphingobium]|uniref:lasso peptide biosynthesis B2 protein n=1 Tax=Novosphingobium TaxID=165696 RepID=UPI0012DF8148|nr:MULTISPECIES: lasso peptide biosynthesis B2 protein [Novosphingobium]